MNFEKHPIERFCKSLCIGLLCILLGGCATTTKGPLFSEVASSKELLPEQGKAVVLIYWQGAQSRARIYANENYIARTPPSKSGFVSFQTKPGKLSISSTTGSGNKAWDYTSGALMGGLVGIGLASSIQKNERVAFDVSPNQVYFVQLYQGAWHEKMKLVSKDIGEIDIAVCHWFNSPQNSKE